MRAVGEGEPRDDVRVGCREVIGERDLLLEDRVILIGDAGEGSIREGRRDDLATAEWTKEDERAERERSQGGENNSTHAPRVVRDLRLHRIMASAWSETKLADGTTAWKCTECGLVVGGRPVSGRPGRCAVCGARAGLVVAVVHEDEGLSMLVLDRRLIDLIRAYRRAKADHERESHAQRLINELGNYDMDDAGVGSDIEASASREQRTALALADATSANARISRASAH